MATQGNEAHQGRTEIVPVLFLYGDGTWSHILANIVDNSPAHVTSIITTMRSAYDMLIGSLCHKPWRKQNRGVRLLRMIRRHEYHQPLCFATSYTL
jgi:hypothetical protein